MFELTMDRQNIERWFAKLLAEVSAGPMKRSITECPSSELLPKLDAETQLKAVSLASDVLDSSSNLHERFCAREILTYCLDHTQKFTDEQQIELVRLSLIRPSAISAAKTAPLLLAYAKKYGNSDELATMAHSMLQFVRGEKTLFANVEKLVLEKNKAYAFDNLIFPGVSWAEDVRHEVRSSTPEQESVWLELLQHARSVGGSKPSAKWLKKSSEHLEKIGTQHFKSCVMRWFSLATGGVGQANADLLKGLVLMASLFSDDEMVHQLGALAEACYKKIPEIGAMNPKVGNACTGALAAITSKEAIVELSKLEAKAKKVSTKSQIDKALQNAATKTGLSVDEMQEKNVPDYGFTDIGKCIKALASFNAEISISDFSSADLSFVNSAGKSTGTVPAAIKDEFSTEIKELKLIAQNVTKLLPSIRYRIEHSLINQRHWNFATWKERFHEHPIVATVSRALIWSFNGKPVFWHDGEFRDLEGSPVEPEDATLVELWHPISSDASVVREWRKRLREWEITQPFKQAHREIYVLTDAERQTENYSNRFAAHIVKNSQFTALCQQRGWKAPSRDDEFAVLKLPRWNMNVEFWVDQVEDDWNEYGGATYLSTDQVRFRRDADNSIPLNEIMPIVFSEVMRDVDLFVGVSSIGTDPDWVAHGEERRTYWHDFSFGELTGSASTRKQVLEEIIPCLKIANRCSFSERFLVVRGDIRTYKIHLGSGNILMEPNDQYLCIVIDRSSGKGKAADKIQLPFKGDQILSVILSKALLLAEDTKITDATIVRQIR